MQKIKQFLESNTGKDVLTVLVVILVGLGSFELGRLSKNSSSGVKIEYPNEVEVGVQGASAVSALEPSTSNNNVKKEKSEQFFFASNRGKKYYPLGCSAGKNIVLENRIYFATREDAERAGYELSSSCK